MRLLWPAVIASPLVLVCSICAAPQREDGLRLSQQSLPSADPIGSNFEIGQLAVNSGKSAAAYDPVSQRYLVIWDCWIDQSETGCAVGGQILAADGTPIGGPFQAANSYYNSEPAVTVAGATTSYFVTVATGGSYVNNDTKVTRIPALQPNQSLGGTASSVSIYHSNPDVGGGIGADDVIVVFDEGAIKAHEFDLITMSTTKRLNLTTSGNPARPAISSSGGSVGRYLITWQMGARIEGTVVDRDLNVLVPNFTIATGPNAVFGADVDGDGTNWVVAYQRLENGGTGDVVCRGVSYDDRSSTVSLTAEAVVAGTVGVAERSPAVACSGESFLIGYQRDFGGGDFDIWVKSIESFGCLVCEGDFQISSASTPDRTVSLASRPGGSDEALVAWIGADLPNNKVRGRLYRADDGLVTELGGGCSGGGTASATCAAVGPGTFGMRTQFAAPLTPGALLLGAAAISAPCGPCTLVTDAIISVPITTDVTGGAELTVALTDPALIGGQLVAQWLVAGNGGCASVLSLSNGLQVTVQ